MLLLVRVPFYLFGDVLTEGDIRHFLLGEKIVSGAWLYIDIFTTEPVLSALFYGSIHFLFGKSLVLYHLISFLLVVIQVLLFNKLVTDNRAALAQTYFPGLFYGLFMSIFPASYTLSPALISLTFVLVAMNFQFNHLEFRVKRDEKIISIGLFLSFSSLLLGATVLYIIAALSVFILFTNTIFRRYLLLIFGFVLPYLLIGGVYIVHGSKNDFSSAQQYLLDTAFSAPSSFWILLILPALFFIRSLPSSLLNRRFTNYQAMLNQAMFMWLLSSVAVIWLSKSDPKQVFLLVVPALALYISHLFISMQSRLKGVYFYLLFGGIIFFNFIDWNRPEFVQGYFEPVKSIERQVDQKFKDKGILLLGEGFEPYLNSSHKSPFFDWSISSTLFEGVPDYEKISRVSRGFLYDPPQLIIDPNNLFGKYVDRIPRLDAMYRHNPAGYWELR